MTKMLTLRALIPVLLIACGAAADDSRTSAVKIIVVNSTPDYWRPWAAGSPQTTGGTGVILSKTRVLTNAHIVRGARQIHIQRAGQAKKWRARVVVTAVGPDLAILELEKNEFAAVKPIKFATKMPQAKDPVIVHGYPVGGEEISTTRGIVSRVEFAGYSRTFSGLRVQIDAALNPGNSGGPALAPTGELIGVVFARFRSSDGVGYLVPSYEIQAFLKDSQDGRFDGPAKLYDQFQPMENTALREARGLGEKQSGVGVRRAHTQTGWPLRAGDVLTHVGPHAIGDDGLVSVGGDLRLSFQFFVPKCVDDGKLPLRIVRSGHVMEIVAPVPVAPDRLFKPLRTRTPRYFFCGPIVFSAVSEEFVSSLNGEWWSFFLSQASPIAARASDTCRFAGEEMVVATTMFPHPTVEGYKDVRGAVLASVNGVRVKNLRHAAELVRAANGKHIELQFAERAVGNIVMRTDEINKTTESVLAENGIRSRSSAALADVWK